VMAARLHGLWDYWLTVRSAHTVLLGWMHCYSEVLIYSNIQSSMALYCTLLLAVVTLT
jgi:hypothetical protein